MMRVLVFQTTRMGDVLQTTPLIRSIRRRHPDAHIALMIRGMGKAIAERNPDINEYLVYDEDETFLDLRAQDSDRLFHAYELAEESIRLIKDKQFDLAYNCTHSISSAMLLKLAEIPQVIGAHLSDDWQYVLRGRWINYFFTSVFHREYNDLNLCDITRHFVEEVPACRELVFDIRGEDRQFVSVLLAEHGVQPEDLVACFQLGASEENKRWAETRFAELARLLAAQRRAKLFLLGVQSEAPLGEAFEKAAPGLAVPLYGKTTVPQVAALLERANVLVTNDTGTMHIAAVVGCPIALVSVGYVHFRETGPYGPGHCAIEWRRPRVGSVEQTRNLLEERTCIRPEQVMRVIDLVINRNQPFAQIEETPELAEVDLHITQFAPDGCLQWYPVVRRPLTEMDFIRMAYRAMWLDYLRTQQDKRSERESVEKLLACYSPPGDTTVAALRKREGAAFDAFAKLAQRGMHVTEELIEHLRKGQSMGKAQQYVTQLGQVDEEMRLFSELHHSCRPLVRIARYERDNLEGADPQVLARTTLQIYRDGFARARLMQKKIDLVADIWEQLTV